MAQKLKLSSPVGSDPLVIKWPVATSEGREGPEEVLETMRLVCEDFPELKELLKTKVLKAGDDVSRYGFEGTKALCDRFNKAIETLRHLVRGNGGKPRRPARQASRRQLKHILQQAYNASVKDPEKLNHYEPFSPEVYGETSFELVEQMIESVRFTQNDYFIDLGSGVGQVILQVAAATNCQFCYGVEKAEWPAQYAAGLEREFRKYMKWYGKSFGDFLIEKGDFLNDNIKDKLEKATIVFVNNFAFGPNVDHELKQRFANHLKEGTRIVSSKAYCPMNFRISSRNLNDIGTIMKVQELSPMCGAVSWTGKAFVYYVHTIDRTLLEKYFARLKNPDKKSQEDQETRRDRRGRPMPSIKDRINGALTGTADMRPDGRKQMSDKGRKKKMKSIKRLNNGPLGQRKMLDKRRRASESPPPPDPPSKPKSKAKPRLPPTSHSVQQQLSVEIDSPPCSPPTPVPRAPPPVTSHSASAVSTASATSSAPSAPAAASSAAAVGGVSSSVITETDSLNLLHAHTLISTSGRDSTEKLSYNDKSMFSSNPFFKPSLQPQTVLEIEKQAGFQNFIDGMKQRFLSFLSYMQSPQYKSIILMQIEQEKRRQEQLRARAAGLQRQVADLQADSVAKLRRCLSQLEVRPGTVDGVLGAGSRLAGRQQELQGHKAKLEAQVAALMAQARPKNGYNHPVVNNRPASKDIKHPVLDKEEKSYSKKRKSDSRTSDAKRERKSLSRKESSDIKVETKSELTDSKPPCPTKSSVLAAPAQSLVGDQPLNKLKANHYSSNSASAKPLLKTAIREMLLKDHSLAKPSDHNGVTPSSISVSSLASSFSSSITPSLWSTELAVPAEVTPSPRILPPGTKILDMKRGSGKAKLQKARSTGTLESNQKPAHKPGPDTKPAPLRDSSGYTETEKSAAQDLVSLKSAPFLLPAALPPNSRAGPAQEHSYCHDKPKAISTTSLSSLSSSSSSSTKSSSSTSVSSSASSQAAAPSSLMAHLTSLVGKSASRQLKPSQPSEGSASAATLKHKSSEPLPKVNYKLGRKSDLFNPDPSTPSVLLASQSSAKMVLLTQSPAPITAQGDASDHFSAKPAPQTAAPKAAAVVGVTPQTSLHCLLAQPPNAARACSAQPSIIISPTAQHPRSILTLATTATSPASHAVQGERQIYFLMSNQSSSRSQLAVSSLATHAATPANTLVNGGAVGHGLSFQGHRVNGHNQAYSINSLGQGQAQTSAHLLDHQGE